MAEAFKLPRMSDTMEEGVITELMIKEGDKISTGDVVAEVETDKAAMELESFQEGTVLHIAVNAGDAVPVDGLMFVLGEPGEDIQAIIDEAASAPAAEAAPVEEAPAPAPAPAAATPAPAPSPSPVPAAAPAPVASNNGRVKASPLAKAMAADNNIDLAQVSGSGDDGRIVKKDIEAFIANPPAAAAPAIQMPTFVGTEKYTEVPVSQMRKTIAKRLSASKFGAPHFYLNVTVNMDRAMEARKRMNEFSPVKISFNDLVIKATAVALKQNPGANASWLGDKIRYNEHVNIGMAVAIEDGLVVPVIRFADGLSLSQISAAAKGYAQKAKEKKIQPDDMAGNTFTISNLGMFGIDSFTAIINPPDACILAVGGIKQVPGVVDGEIKPVNEMKLTLSCDHRVVDGAVGSQFLNTLKSLLEDPVRLLV